jgi:hypothetical protein
VPGPYPLERDQSLPLTEARGLWEGEPGPVWEKVESHAAMSWDG